MALIEGNNSDLFVTALSEIFEDLEISNAEEQQNIFLEPLPSFKNFFNNNNTTADGVSCSTPKRPFQRVFRRKHLPMDDGNNSPLPSKTPEEVANLAAPKKPELPLPQLPPVVLTPWSKIIRDAILEREHKMKKAAPAVTQRMSMRL